MLAENAAGLIIVFKLQRHIRVLTSLDLIRMTDTNIIILLSHATSLKIFQHLSLIQTQIVCTRIYLHINYITALY